MLQNLLLIMVLALPTKVAHLPGPKTGAPTTASPIVATAVIVANLAMMTNIVQSTF